MLEQHIEAAKVMVKVLDETDTMLEAVEIVGEQFPGVTREHLIMLWVGANAARQVSVPKVLVKELLEVTEGYKEWVHAVPDTVVDTLPAMPGMDGDWADGVLDSVKKLLK